MARPIAPTPVLRGKDAEKFIRDIKNTKPYVPPTFDYNEMRAAVRAVMAKNDQK